MHRIISVHIWQAGGCRWRAEFPGQDSPHEALVAPPQGLPPWGIYQSLEILRKGVEFGAESQTPANVVVSIAFYVGT